MIQNDANKLASNENNDKFSMMWKIISCRNYSSYALSHLKWIEDNIKHLYQAGDDVRFTQLVRDTNRELEKLIKAIDTEEISIGNVLHDNGKKTREEVHALLTEDDNDNDIKKRLDLIEEEDLRKASEKEDEPRFNSQPNTKNVFTAADINIKSDDEYR